MTKLTKVILALTLSIAFQAHALKILVAGDQDPNNKPFFYQIAKQISEASPKPNQRHTVFFLSNEIDPIFKIKESNTLIKYGIGSAFTFEWDANESDEANYNRLDLQAARAYFGHEPMLYEMKKQQFDIGIGGLAHADALLFRYLNIPYIKLAAEDIESYVMQQKLDMPVIASIYPSSQIFSRFGYQRLP
jgi:hypothetical protein